jgi:zinc protease
MNASSLIALPGQARVSNLDNGLTVCLLDNPQAPLVTTALWYRVGTRDETPGRGGTAHFLEHMMFKGSARYGRGEIDRRTHALGGLNNAFTSHDATTYYFNFARDRWSEALAIEADRLAGLNLDPAEVDSERQVILEEIAMYESDPWDALEQRVLTRLFGGHPYGRPVLGTAPELERIGPNELATFHRDFYRPDNAVLIVAGDLGDDALERVEEHLGAVPAGARRRPALPDPRFPSELVRVERRHGEVSRLLMALPVPPASDPSYPAVRLLAGLLASGRASRLHRSLVEDTRLCAWVMADVMECTEPAALIFATELVEGSDPARVEDELLDRLRELTAEPPAVEEVERAARMTLADWVYDHERIHQQALAAGFGLALFDLEHKERQLRELLTLGQEDIHETARTILRPARGGVVGWSLPARAAEPTAAQEVA